VLDDLAAYNKKRWEELAQAGVPYSLPNLGLTPESAMAAVNSTGILGPSLEGKDVLCLASGGGQQSAIFGLLGANVTVLDLCETQLERDREAARYYGLEIRTVQGDMRDLSCFPKDSFDIVWHAHALNFVPDAPQVFREVARVIRRGGIYRLKCWGPHSHGASEVEWTGKGYVVSQPYRDGPVDWADEHWDVKGPDGVDRRVLGPHEFRHTLTTLINGMCDCGFRILRVAELSDGAEPGATPEPGTWEHFGTVLPQWLVFWARWEPSDGMPTREAR